MPNGSKLGPFIHIHYGDLSSGSGWRVAGWLDAAETVPSPDNQRVIWSWVGRFLDRSATVSASQLKAGSLACTYMARHGYMLITLYDVIHSTYTRTSYQELNLKSSTSHRTFASTKAVVVRTRVGVVSSERCVSQTRVFCRGNEGKGGSSLSVCLSVCMEVPTS